jgi:hypothetical protein
MARPTAFLISDCAFHMKVPGKNGFATLPKAPGHSRAQSVIILRNQISNCKPHSETRLYPGSSPIL